MRIRNLFLAIVMAGLSFGGTFTCNSNDDDDDDFHVSSSSTSSGGATGSVASYGSSAAEP